MSFSLVLCHGCMQIVSGGPKTFAPLIATLEYSTFKRLARNAVDKLAAHGRSFTCR